MKNISILTSINMKNNMRSRALTIIFIIITLMLSAGLALLFSLVFISPEIKSASPDRVKLETYLSLILHTTCFISLGINTNIFSFESMVKEKSKGNIESLLATPFRPVEIWIGKSLAVFAPGFILGEILTFIVLVAINLIYFIPGFGFLIPPWVILSSFIGVPLVYLALIFLVNLISLTGKPASGNIVTQIFLPAGLTLEINLIVRDFFIADSWPMFIINTGMAVVMLVIILFLIYRLTRERIILSC